MNKLKYGLFLGTVSLAVFLLVFLFVAGIFSKGTSYYVAPGGNDSNSGTARTSPLATIGQALALAEPGDEVLLADGEYEESIITKKSGTSKRPIVVTGSKQAVLRGGQNPRIFEINHDFVVLDGFTIDGQKPPGTNRDNFHDKLIYVVGTGDNQTVEGVRILNMALKNAGGECVRLRNIARNNEVAFNSIERCGVYDYVFLEGHKNGEGIYIGTAPEQLEDNGGVFLGPDTSADNFVHHNHINTMGNECVDIKESAVNNIVEDNYCTGQQDSESGGISVRGDDNIIRRNTLENNVGAGIRIGGDKEEHGTHNEVSGNIIRNNQGYGLKILRGPQGRICGNHLENNAGGIINDIELTADISPQNSCE